MNSEEAARAAVFRASWVQQAKDSTIVSSFATSQENTEATHAHALHGRHTRVDRSGIEGRKPIQREKDKMRSDSCNGVDRWHETSHVGRLPSFYDTSPQQRAWTIITRRCTRIASRTRTLERSLVDFGTPSFLVDGNPASKLVSGVWDLRSSSTPGLCLWSHMR